jgi:hypothetical protein
MATTLATAEVQAFLQRLGERYPHPVKLYLLGGSALCLLGSPRRTLDIDYTTEAPSAAGTQLQTAIDTLATEMRLELEAVPIAEFIPLPDDAHTRHRWVGQFGGLAVYIYDPYSIALSKVARGFEADLEDVLFLLRQNLIDLEQLTTYVTAALPTAWDFDIDPQEMQQHMAAVRRLFAQ